MLKQQEFENVKNVVNNYNDYIKVISSIHKDSNEQIYWEEILNELPPQEPYLSNTNQKLAEQNLNNYKPTFWDRLFRLESNKINKLNKLIEYAKQKDFDIFEKEKEKYNLDLSEWKKNNKLAQRVISQDIQAYQEVLEYLNPFADIKEIGSKINISFQKEYLVVRLVANGTDVIPDFIVSQTSIGKLSQKKMPISRFNELYQDYVVVY